MPQVRPSLTLCAAVLFLAACEKEEPSTTDVVRPVKAIQVSTNEALYRRSFPGRAQAVQEVELSFRVSGPLVDLPVDVGDTVVAGDLVAQMDGRDYAVQVREALGNLSDAEAALRRASADLDRLLAVMAEDPGATSQSAVDEAREARDRARASVTTATASLNATEDDLEDTYLRAPFDGTVVSTYVENFEEVAAKQPVVRIVDDRQLEMVIGIPESLISLAGQARNLRAIFDAFPGRALPARITEIGTEASETTRTYPVTVTIDQPTDFRVLSGMAGQVLGDPPEGAEGIGLIVPISALFSEAQDSLVWVIEEASGTVRKRTVELGEYTEQGQSIISGITEGEWVVTAGANFLVEGQQVQILNAAGG